MGVETLKETQEPQEIEETHEQFLSRISEINVNINRIYDEMEADEQAIIKIERNKIDQIKRLEGYYRELHRRGAFVEPKTLRQRRLNEVNNVILEEMEKREFTSVTRRWVNHCLSDDCKREWRAPKIDTIDGKGKDFSLPDLETQHLYDELLDHINEVANIDYMELPKQMRLAVAERVYKTYKYHDKEWTKHDLTVVKHEDGLNIPDPFSGIIRVEEGIPYEGEIYDVLKEIRKSVTEIMKKARTGILDKDGNRIITLKEEHEIAMGLRTLDGYFNPMANYKWKRDVPNWAKILLKKFVLKSKSGAEKFSRKNVSSNFYDFFEEQERGITREEIAKMEKRLCIFFLQFIKHHPGLMALSTLFEKITEEKRAAHSIKMNPKLSDRA